MTAVELINDLTARGVALSLEHGRLKYAAPPGVMTDALKQMMTHFKPEVIALLDGMSDQTSFFNASEELKEPPHDVAARESKWLTLCSGEAYMQTLTRAADIFLLRDGNTWTVWRGDWFEHEPKPIREKIIVQGLPFNKALERGNSYVEWHRKTFRKGEK